MAEKRDRDSALPPPLALPSTNKKRKKQGGREVLDEEEYVNLMDMIVERDFFPSLPLLRLQKQYYDAIEDNDIDLARETEMKYNKLMDIEEKKRKGEEVEELSETDEFYDDVDEEYLINKRKINNLSLDQFHFKHVGEDNASFLELMEKDKERIKQKYWWLFEQEKKNRNSSLAITGTDRLLMITNGDKEKEQSKETNTEEETNKSLVERRPVVLMDTAYVAKNHLMYFPEGIITPLTPNYKTIHHRNTNLPPGLEVETNNNSRKDEVANSNKTNVAPNNDISSLIGRHSNVPIDLDQLVKDKKDHRFIATPSPLIGGQSPIITYGRIASTPYILGNNDMPVEKLDKSKNKFHLQSTPQRELVAMKLVDDVIKKTKNKHMNSKKTGMARTSVMASPMLNNHIRTNKMSMDSQLRAHYSSTPARSNLTTPRRVQQEKTPAVRHVTSTPQIANVRNELPNVPSSSTMEPVGIFVETKIPDTTQNITDNLLEI